MWFPTWFPIWFPIWFTIRCTLYMYYCPKKILVISWKTFRMKIIRPMKSWHRWSKIFHHKVFSDFPRWRTKKHQERNFLHYRGVFQVGKNDFFNENFQFFTPTYFPIFQDGGTKNSKKGTFCMADGFSSLEKTIFLMKIFNFSPQRIFRISKMAEKK